MLNRRLLAFLSASAILAAPVAAQAANPAASLSVAGAVRDSSVTSRDSDAIGGGFLVPAVIVVVVVIGIILLTDDDDPDSP